MSKNNVTANLNGYCRDCGWPCVDCMANDEVGEIWEGTDYVIYCANKGCKNHSGRAYFQDLPEFVTDKSKKMQV